MQEHYNTGRRFIPLKHDRSAGRMGVVDSKIEVGGVVTPIVCKIQHIKLSL
jgi:hypothetical protein